MRVLYNHLPNPAGPCLPGIPGGPLKSVSGLIGQDIEVVSSLVSPRKLVIIIKHNTKININDTCIATTFKAPFFKILVVPTFLI